MAKAARLGLIETGRGTPLLCIHGFPLDRRLWRRQLERLGDIRRVLAPDLRGRGPSRERFETGWSLDDHADDLAALLAELREPVVDLAGVSMGGYVAFALLRRHPERVRSLILIDTKASADNAEGKAAREASAAAVREKGVAVLVEQMLPKLITPGASAAVRAAVQEMIEDTPRETAARDLLAMRDRPDSTPMLGEIRVPTLVIHGSDDALMPIDGARAMAAAIGGAKFVAIPGAGHLPMLEAPDEFNAALRGFLRR